MKIVELEKQAVILKNIESKGTARCPRQEIYTDKNGNEYLRVTAETLVQRFYLARSIKMQKKWGQALNQHGFMLNLPLDVRVSEEKIEVLYAYFEGLKECRSLEPVKRLKKFWKDIGHIEINSNEVTEKCMENFLAAWPENYHDLIKGLDTYSEYIATLLRKKQIFVGFEHGDFTKNNILVDNTGRFWLMDFEFAKESQPYGMDEYDLRRTLNRKSFFYKDPIAEQKLKLMDDINNIVDGI